MTKKILILGGYGNTGVLIAKGLLSRDRCEPGAGRPQSG